MGLVCSRPVSDLLEQSFLKGAQFIDHLVRLINKCLQGAVTACFSAVFGKNTALVQERRHDRLCLSNPGGICLTKPGAHRIDEKHRRSERRRRAEAAALGRQVSRKRSTIANHQGYGRVAGADPDEQQKLLQQSLGEPARAPPPRPEAERETAREKEKGKLWVMGNIAASSNAPQPCAPPVQPLEPVRPKQARLAEATAEAPRKRTTIKQHQQQHREGMPLVGENHPLIPMKHQEHHSQQVSTECKVLAAAAAPNVEVIASSSSNEILEAPPPAPRKAAVAAGRDNHEAAAAKRPPAAATPMKEIKPHVSSKPSPVSGDKIRPQAPGGQSAASGFHSKPQTLVSSNTSDLAILHSGALTSRKTAGGGAISPPTDVSGHEVLKLSAAPLTTPFDGPPPTAMQTSRAKQELRKQKPKTSLDIRRIMEPEAKPAVDELAAAKRMSRPSPVTAAMRPRVSLDALAIKTSASAGAGVGTASDAASIHSMADSLASVRAGSPLGVAELADRACLSAQDAPRKERKVWKDEVERLAIQKMRRQDAARRSSCAGLAQQDINGIGGKALKRIETQDGRLR